MMDDFGTKRRALYFFYLYAAFLTYDILERALDVWPSIIKALVIAGSITFVAYLSERAKWKQTHKKSSSDKGNPLSE